MGLNHYSPVILQLNPLQPGELSLNPLQPGELWRKIRSSPVILHENPLQPGDSTIKFISASAFPVKSITARWFSSKIHSSPVILQLNPFQPPVSWTFGELSVNFRVLRTGSWRQSSSSTGALCCEASVYTCNNIDEKRTSYKRIYTNNRPSQLSTSNAIIGKVWVQ